MQAPNQQICKFGYEEMQKNQVRGERGARTSILSVAITTHALVNDGAGQERLRRNPKKKKKKAFEES